MTDPIADQLQAEVRAEMDRILNSDTPAEPDTREREYYTTTLQCDLSDEDVVSFANALTDVLQRYDDTDAERKEVAKDFTHRLNRLHADGVRIRTSIETRKETRTVDCERIIDRAQRLVTCVRMDTGETIDSFALTDDDGQTDIEDFVNADPDPEFRDAEVEEIDVTFDRKSDMSAVVFLLETSRGVYMDAGWRLGSMEAHDANLTRESRRFATRKDAIGAAYQDLTNAVRDLPETANHLPTKRAAAAFADIDAWLDAELVRINAADGCDPAAELDEAEQAQ